MSTPLAALRPGQSGTVAGFSVVDDLALRLMQMGVIEGTRVELLRFAPAGDPLEIAVMGYRLSLRASEAVHVLLDDVT
jgi:ferrous iron transport protein A